MKTEKTVLCDSHLHFNFNNENPINNLHDYFNNEIEYGTLIINTKKEYDCLLEAYNKGLISPNMYIILGINKNESFYTDAISFCQKNKIVFGIKLHPRLFNIKNDELHWYYEQIKIINPKVIIVDDFLYGDTVDDNISVEITCALARMIPQSKIILAHSGGAELLKHVMKTKIYKNVFYDLSLTVNYMKYSSVEMDLKWLITFMHSRVMLGSDYPDFTINQAYEQALSLLGPNPDNIILNDICENTYKKVFLLAE